MNNNTNNQRGVMGKICWVPAAEGGRKHPPRGPRYSTVARFDKETEKWPKEAWSIVAEFKKVSDDLSSVIAELRCLAPEAPSHLLQPGSTFELYEGSRLVAHGEVLSDGVESISGATHSQAEAEMAETP